MAATIIESIQEAGAMEAVLRDGWGKPRAPQDLRYRSFNMGDIASHYAVAFDEQGRTTGMGIIGVFANEVSAITLYEGNVPTHMQLMYNDSFRSYYARQDRGEPSGTRPSLPVTVDFDLYGIQTAHSDRLPLKDEALLAEDGVCYERNVDDHIDRLQFFRVPYMGEDRPTVIVDVPGSIEGLGDILVEMSRYQQSHQQDDEDEDSSDKEEPALNGDVTLFRIPLEFPVAIAILDASERRL